MVWRPILKRVGGWGCCAAAELDDARVAIYRERHPDPWSLFSPGAALMDAGIQTDDGEAEGEAGIWGGWHCIESPRKQSPSNNRSPDCRGAQSSPCPQCPPNCQIVGVNWARSYRRVHRVVRPWVSSGPAGPSQHARCGSIDGAQRPTTRLQPSGERQPGGGNGGKGEGILSTACFCPFAGPSRLGRCKPPRESAVGLPRNRLGLLGCCRRGSIEALDVAASVANTRQQGFTWR